VSSCAEWTRSGVLCLRLSVSFWSALVFLGGFDVIYILGSFVGSVFFLLIIMGPSQGGRLLNNRLTKFSSKPRSLCIVDGRVFFSFPKSEFNFWILFRISLIQSASDINFRYRFYRQTFLIPTFSKSDGAWSLWRV